MGITTIHLKIDCGPKARALAKELYDQILKHDPKFHFFFEPALILRITKRDCLTRTRRLLQAKNIEFDEYDYPCPCPPEGRFGKRFGEGGFVASNSELFLAVFHANSVAALIMSEDEHRCYLERLIHTAFNPRGLSHSEEGEALKKLAELKLGYKLSQAPIE